MSRKKLAEKTEKKPIVLVGQNRQYELAVVVSSEVKAEKRKDVIGKITKMIADVGGTPVGDTLELGLRDLAYPIQHQTSGWYAILDISVPGDTIKSIDMSLGREKDIIRHLLVRKP